VRPYREVDAPRLRQSSVTITRAGRVLLDADWQPHLRELRVSEDGDEVLLNEEDFAELEAQIEIYLTQRLGERSRT